MYTYLISSTVVILAAILIFIFYIERTHLTVTDIMIIVVMSTIAIVGRAIFSFIPQIQPSTVVIIITGIYMGWQAGFLTGSLCALVSNLLLGQGPWTSWQMFAWGSIGLFAAILFRARILHRKKLFYYIFVSLYAFISAFYYSILMDMWTLESLSYSLFSKEGLIVISTGLIFNITHAVFNIVFTILFLPSFNKTFLRLYRKYNLRVNVKKFTIK